jgi:transglutaminase superfamily protein/coenzyme PQQ synthesis protein D (PqqD)
MLMEAQKLHPTDTIRFAEIDGFIVILDISTQDYFVLNTTSTRVWKTLRKLDGDVDATIHAVAVHYSATSRSQIVTDVQHVIQEWKRMGFLGTSSSTVSLRPSKKKIHLPKLRMPLELYAWLSLAMTALSLRWRGFSQTYRYCANLPSPPQDENITKLFGDAESAFVRAENLFHFANAPADCLPRSLALFRFCRSVGLPAIHRIGCRRFPQLSMHAWVECGGQVMLDDPECTRDYVLLSSIPP